MRLKTKSTIRTRIVPEIQNVVLYWNCPNFWIVLVIANRDRQTNKRRETQSLRRKVIKHTCPVYLQFAWGVAEAKCVVVTAVCVSVCLSIAAFSQYFTDPDVTWGMVGVPSSCALLGGFAIGARVSLLWQHSTEREMSASACTRSLPAFCCLNNDDDDDDDANVSVYAAVIISRIAIARFHLVYFMNSFSTPDDSRPSDQANRLGLWVLL